MDESDERGLANPRQRNRRHSEAEGLGDRGGIYRRGRETCSCSVSARPTLSRKQNEKIQVRKHVAKHPLFSISPWSSDPKENELGRLHGKNLYDAVETVAKMLYAAGISHEEFPDYVQQYRRNLEDPKLKIYHLW